MEQYRFSELLRRALCVIAALAAAAAITGCGKQPAETLPGETTPGSTEATTLPAETVMLTVDSVAEQDGQMVVTASWCVLRYPFAFGDLIQVTAKQTRDVSALCFAARIGEETPKIFDLRFGGSEGICLGTLELPGTGETVQVYGVLHEPGDSLSEAQMSTFRAVQETFNDVCASLAENPGFVPAA